MNKNMKILLIVAGLLTLLIISATIGAMTQKEYYCNLCGSDDLTHIDYGSPAFECNECGHEGYMPHRQSIKINTFVILTSSGLLFILLLIHAKATVRREENEM